MSFSKPITFAPSKKSFLVSAEKYHVTTKDRRGYNTIYGTQRSRTYFFELADQRSNTNELHLKIHTNDHKVNTSPIRYKSTSLMPNARYQISTMVRHSFTLQRVLPRRIQQKYFNLIRDNLLKRIDALKYRIESSPDSNKTTKTFFKFTYKRYRFYFGIYIPCLDKQQDLYPSSLQQYSNLHYVT